MESVSMDLLGRLLIERKQPLRKMIPQQPFALLYADHIERNGVEFFSPECQRELDCFVAKLRRGRYGEGRLEIRNPGYSQREGRRDLFEKKHTATVRWASLSVEHLQAVHSRLSFPGSLVQYS